MSMARELAYKRIMNKIESLMKSRDLNYTEATVKVRPRIAFVVEAGRWNPEEMHEYEYEEEDPYFDVIHPEPPEIEMEYDRTGEVEEIVIYFSVDEKLVDQVTIECPILGGYEDEIQEFINTYID